MRRERIETPVQRREGLAMRWQHQRVVRQRAEAFQRGEEGAERVGHRLARMQPDIGRDARQDLVGRDQHLRLGAIQAGHVRRVALAGHHPPFAPADRQRVAVGDGVEGARQGRYGTLVQRPARPLEIARMRPARPRCARIPPGARSYPRRCRTTANAPAAIRCASSSVSADARPRATPSGPAWSGWKWVTSKPGQRPIAEGLAGQRGGASGRVSRHWRCRRRWRASHRHPPAARH